MKTARELTGMSKAKLVEVIQYHNHRYLVENQPEISDTEYDRLTEALRSIAPNHPALMVTGNCDDPNDWVRERVLHPVPMLSLQKAYSIDEIIQWAKNYSVTVGDCYDIQPKYDGIALAVYFENQRILPVTRGQNGTSGLSLQDRFQYVDCGFGDISNTFGELVMSFADFDKYFKEKYANPRAAVSALVNMKFPWELKPYQNVLQYIPYSAFSLRVRGDCLELGIRQTLRQFSGNCFPFPTDGIVIKFSDPKLYERAGKTEHHPRGAIALKFKTPYGKEEEIPESDQIRINF